MKVGTLFTLQKIPVTQSHASRNTLNFNRLAMRSLFLISFTLVAATAFGQPGWNWPEDETLKEQAKEKQAYYKIQAQLDDQNATFNTLQWLYQNNPELNPSIYIDGAKTLGIILKDEKDPERKTRLQDSLLWMYDQRVTYFGKEEKVVDRKAYDAFKQFYRNRSRYPQLLELYQKNFELNGNDVSDFNLIPYMTLAKFYYEWQPETMTGEMVLEIHSQVSDALVHKMANGGKTEKLKKDQDKVDALLTSLDGVLSCDFIGEKLVPRLEADPTDINTAKKIFKYSLQAKCTSEAYFTTAGEIVYADNPTHNLAKALGDKYASAEDYDKAHEYYDKGIELAEVEEEKYDLYLNKANAYYKTGNKSQARATAYKASSINPNAPEPFNLIGNLYFGSFQDCKEGKSKVKDRAVFIAAQIMYKKAGNEAQMTAASEQFPSIEDIFNENYEEGDEVEIGCWINTSVSVERRP